MEDGETYVGEETLLGEKRHLCLRRDTCVGEETLFGEKRHLCRRRDTFGGKVTPVSAWRHFWGKNKRVEKCLLVDTGVSFPQKVSLRRHRCLFSPKSVSLPAQVFCSKSASSPKQVSFALVPLTLFPSFLYTIETALLSRGSDYTLGLYWT